MDGEMVHRGFQDQYKERRGPLLQLMEQLDVIEQLKASNKPLLLTGHRCAVPTRQAMIQPRVCSLGGAVACLMARELLARDAAWACNNGNTMHVHSMMSLLTSWMAVVLVTFGSPKCGNRAFAEQLRQLKNQTRCVHANDFVPQMPPTRTTMCQFYLLFCAIRSCMVCWVKQEVPDPSICSMPCQYEYSHVSQSSSQCSL